MFNKELRDLCILRSTIIMIESVRMGYFGACGIQEEKEKCMQSFHKET